MKIALCFIISGEHTIKKEHLWVKWIEYIKESVNVYIFYSTYSKIKSHWIKKYCIPRQFICNVDYYHIIPAYVNLIRYAMIHDQDNQWFCFLTESCCPISNPNKFYETFLEYNEYSIMKWKNSDWNMKLHNRANLYLIPQKYHLKNSPYFILCKQDALNVLYFIKNNKREYLTISSGIIANESLFIIIIMHSKRENNLINMETTITDWNRMTSPTSPYVFNYASIENIKYIKREKNNKFSFFLRKIGEDFSNYELTKLIFDE